MLNHLHIKSKTKSKPILSPPSHPQKYNREKTPRLLTERLNILIEKQGWISLLSLQWTYPEVWSQELTKRTPSRFAFSDLALGSPLWVSTGTHFPTLPLGMTSSLMWWHLSPSHLFHNCAKCFWASCQFFLEGILTGWLQNLKPGLVLPSCSSSDSDGVRSWMGSLSVMPKLRENKANQSPLSSTTSTIDEKQQSSQSLWSMFSVGTYTNKHNEIYPSRQRLA